MSIFKFKRKKENHFDNCTQLNNIDEFKIINAFRFVDKIEFILKIDNNGSLYIDSNIFTGSRFLIKIDNTNVFDDTYSSISSCIILDTHNIKLVCISYNYETIIYDIKNDKIIYKIDYKIANPMKRDFHYIEKCNLIIFKAGSELFAIDTEGKEYINQVFEHDYVYYSKLNIIIMYNKCSLSIFNLETKNTDNFFDITLKTPIKLESKDSNLIIKNNFDKYRLMNKLGILIGNYYDNISNIIIDDKSYYIAKNTNDNMYLLNDEGEVILINKSIEYLNKDLIRFINNENPKYYLLASIHNISKTIIINDDQILLGGKLFIAKSINNQNDELKYNVYDYDLNKINTFDIDKIEAINRKEELIKVSYMDTTKICFYFMINFKSKEIKLFNNTGEIQYVEDGDSQNCIISIGDFIGYKDTFINNYLALHLDKRDKYIELLNHLKYTDSNINKSIDNNYQDEDDDIYQDNDVIVKSQYNIPPALLKQIFLTQSKKRVLIDTNNNGSINLGTIFSYINLYNDELTKYFNSHIDSYSNHIYYKIGAESILNSFKGSRMTDDVIETIKIDIINAISKYEATIGKSLEEDFVSTYII